MEYIVDLQGFRRAKNIFVLKEMAVVDAKKDYRCDVYIFKPPCKWKKLLKEEQRVNRHLENSFHGIEWESGTIPYEKVIKTIQYAFQDVWKIYVKGYEKKKWLEEILYDTLICNMDDMGCPSLRKLRKYYTQPRCNNHRFGCDPVCAVQNAQVLKKWLLAHHVPLYKCASIEMSSLNSLFISPLHQDEKEMSNNIFNTMYN